MLEQAQTWLRQARSIAMLTGAGVSAESGVPTFRDAQTGIWARYRPEELATEEAFRRYPRQVWSWYAERRENLQHVQPNAGHLAVAGFQQRHPGRLTLITQNVDGLHQKAGSTGVLALHGNLFADRWLDACPKALYPRAACSIEQVGVGRPPRCPECGNLARPAVVWFGEMLPMVALRAAEYAARQCEVMLVAGTSGAVYPAAGLAHQARAAGAKVVIVGPDATDLDDIADAVLTGTSAQILPRLLEG